MRLSRPCSRMRSSAGEISSPSFSSSLRFSSRLEACSASSTPGTTNAAPAIELHKKLRRVREELAMNFSFLSGVRSSPSEKGSCGRVDAKNLHEIGHLSEMPQRVLRGFIVSAQKIDIKDVLPGTSSHGPRFNLTQADIAQGEYAQRFKECSRHVLHFEGNGSLIGSPGNQALIHSPNPGVRPTRTANLSYQKETGEVAFLILDPGFQDL